MSKNIEKTLLYGINHSNRKPKDHWGKNQFNSSFPVALACYMRDRGIKPVYLTLNENLQVVPSEIPFDEVFNTNLSNQYLSFNFESKFDGYQKFAYDDIKSIDLVVSDTSKNQLRPLEIKLTVIPDNTTHKLTEDQWGSELVIRPATTTYLGLGIAHSCESKLPLIRKKVEPLCSQIKDWGNHYEIKAKISDILDALDSVEKSLLEFQKPMLLQPIWKTKGKSPILSEDAFDIFVWSDFALSRLFLDPSKDQINGNSITRQIRSSARFIRFLYQVSTSGKANLATIYTEMTFKHQTDKEFAVPGKITRTYMNSPRILKPKINVSELNKIILPGGEKLLSPERRLDQSIYLSTVLASEIKGDKNLDD